MQGCGGCSTCNPGGWTCNGGNGCGTHGVCSCPSGKKSAATFQVLRILSSQSQMAAAAPGQCQCSEGYAGDDCKSCSVGWWSKEGTCEQCQCGSGSCDPKTGACAKSNSPSPQGPTPPTPPKPSPPKPSPPKPSPAGGKTTCLLHLCLNSQQWRILVLCSAGVGVLIIVLLCIGCYVRCSRSRRKELQMGRGGAPITRESLLRPLNASMGEDNDVLVYPPPPELPPPAWSNTDEKEHQHVVQVSDEVQGSRRSSTSMSSGMSYPPPENPDQSVPRMTDGASVSFDYS